MSVYAMSRLFEKLFRPVLFRVPAETAHDLGMWVLRKGLADGPGVVELPALKTNQFGLDLANPLGIAAGFDKNGVAVSKIARLGFGFVEVGTVTHKPQPGNPKPRMFRLPADMALINRLGFNNEGAEAVARRLSSVERKCVIGINIGKNKDVPNEEAVENYLASFDILQPLADYVAVNISSPNTPNLRELQKGENLDELLAALEKRNEELGPKPILVKIAPDLSDNEIEEAVAICRRRKVAGMIATNTTVSRDGLRSANAAAIGAGGLSGRPLFERSNEVIRKIFRYSEGSLPIIGVGGIFTAEDAFAKVSAGASLLQAYTGFVYGGPSFASDVLYGLAKLLEANGIGHLREAVGRDV